VVVYATSPVRKVLGWFEVAGLEAGSPGQLWRRFGARGGITSAEFRDYYESRTCGTAIVVGDVVTLDRPLPIAALGVDPPQSFRYLDYTAISRLSPRLIPT
jgi:predicted transcriptional regulator